MCQVHNEIGCLTTIKSHLYEHGINEYKSINELINFQKNYTVINDQILSANRLLIENEKDSLEIEIKQLYDSIKTKKAETESLLLKEIDNLSHQLINLSSKNSNTLRKIINYINKFWLQLKIKSIKGTFDFKVASSVASLNEYYITKSDRYQYINSYFDNAVIESSQPKLQELERKKHIIDQLNSSIYGAIGEQKVVKELKKLSNDYTLINDFKTEFNPAIYNRQENDYIKSIQIDHILLSPSGIFLIETKNWSDQSLRDKSLFSPVRQIKRTNFALYRLLNNEFHLTKHHWGKRTIPIRNLIVFINNKPSQEFQHVKILTLNNLLNYINYFEPSFSSSEIHDIANYLHYHRTF
jgi:hypothetical protein